MSEHHDRQDIAEVTVRYATGIDTRDWDLLRTCFTDDCRVDYGRIGVWDGVDAVIAHMAGSRVATGGHSLHRITNQAITLKADHAQCRSYVDAVVMAADNKTGHQAVGFYEDELVRTEHGWRIATRRFTTARISTLGT